MIRLPPTASSASLQAWTQEYLESLPDPKVLCVSFLQPYVVVDSTNQASYVAHYFGAAASSALIHHTRQALKLVTPFGVATSQPPEWRVESSHGAVNLGDQYVYQSGKHFVLAQADGPSLRCNISQKAPGVEEIAVFNIQGKPLLLEGRWGAELLIVGG
jgi:hypothetical protein